MSNTNIEVKDVFLKTSSTGRVLLKRLTHNFYCTAKVLYHFKCPFVALNHLLSFAFNFHMKFAFFYFSHKFASFLIRIPFHVFVLLYYRFNQKEKRKKEIEGEMYLQNRKTKGFLKTLDKRNRIYYKMPTSMEFGPQRQMNQFLILCEDQNLQLICTANSSH